MSANVAAMATGGPNLASDSRRMILDTAAKLFRNHGYAAVSLRDLAAACGMKAGSLYYHFASKDEIVAEVLRIGVERIYVEVTRATAACADDAPPEEVIRVAVRAHLRALLELQDYTSANLRILGQVPAEVRAAHVELRDTYERSWAAMLSRLAPSASMTGASASARSRKLRDKRHLHLARFFLIGAMNGTLEWFRPGETSVDDLADQFTTIFLSGVRGLLATGSKP